MCDLADEAQLSRSGLTRLVDRLERDGLLERCSCEQDARGSYACLTPAGRERLQEARGTHLAVMREHFFSRFSEGELLAAGGYVGAHRAVQRHGRRRSAAAGATADAGAGTRALTARRSRLSARLASGFAPPGAGLAASSPAAERWASRCSRTAVGGGGARGEKAPDERSPREAVDPERLDRVLGGLAEEVGEQADRRRPADSSERVPEHERAPAHVGRARDPRGPGTQPEDEATEEHGLRAVALEERLAGAQDLPPLALEARRVVPAASDRPCGRSDSRGCRRRSRPAAATAITNSICSLPRLASTAGGDQAGLARHRHTGRLRHHDHEQQRIAGDFDEVADVDQGEHRWRAARAQPCPISCFRRRAVAVRRRSA